MVVIVLAADFAEGSLRILEAVVLALATTAISLRLLGIRRGWGTAFVSGAVGWGLGAGLVLGLSDWDWGADGLLAQMVAIAVPATMAIAVALDLLARPGSLAAPELAGLIVTPRPLRAIRRRIDVVRRHRELIALGRRQGFGPFLGAGGIAERAAEPVGVRLRRVLEEAGGVYVKIGHERVESLANRYVGTRYYVFEGGCTTYRFDLSDEGRTSLINEASLAMSFVSRSEVAERLERAAGLEL